MPLFEFKCGECEGVFEKITKAVVSVCECPKCGGRAEKQISAPGGFNLKGEGFYATDFKHK